MSLRLSPRSQILDAGSHIYRVLYPDGDVDWLEHIADRYVELRTECTVPLSEISLDGITVLRVDRLRERLARASIPARRLPKNFDVIRSDFGETASYMLLADMFRTRFGYLSVRDRELAALPGRGIDVVGVEDNDHLILLLGEVKVSDEDRSPPQVVDNSHDCLRNQHLGHLNDLPATASKIFDCSRHVQDRDTRDLLLAAALLAEEGRWDLLQIVSFCFLVRPEDLHGENDFGSFRNSPRDYGPAHVRFVVFCVPGRIEPMVDVWYQLVTSR